MLEDDALIIIKGEYERAIAKFDPFNSNHEGYAVILEEMDELWQEIKANTPHVPTEKMTKEAIQVAAMALRFLVDRC